jgi:hypothetical protein
VVVDRLKAARYVAPLREGGSLPAIVDTEPPGRYVVKFRGAGQGPKALIAELLAAGLADALQLPVPDWAVVELAEGFGRGEPDPEIQDLLRGSVGENFGLAFLPGAIGFDVAVDRAKVDPDLAADVVWFDAYLTNPDRVARNPNLLIWQDRPWLIDHGAALYFHHRWEGWEGRARAPFPQIKDHVLLPRAADLAAADARLRPRLTREAIRRVVAAIPEEWLSDDKVFSDRAAQREAYVAYLTTRLQEPRAWLTEAIDARRAS